jgi:mycoredoxin
MACGQLLLVARDDRTIKRCRAARRRPSATRPAATASVRIGLMRSSGDPRVRQDVDVGRALREFGGPVIKPPLIKPLTELQPPSAQGRKARPAPNSLPPPQTRSRYRVTQSRNPQPPITVFGRTTCEDTAIVRDRLRALAVPFTDVDLDRDAGAARLVETLNDGNQVTPTVLFGGADSVLREPSLDMLDRRLVDDGWPISRPPHSEFKGRPTARPLPAATLLDAAGDPYRLTDREGRDGGLAIFFAHAADCRACSGYARQLAAVGPKLAEADIQALVVVPGGPDVATNWRAESTDKIPIVADHGGRWKAAVSAHIAAAEAPNGAIILAVDRDLAPRMGSTASDAGGLGTPLDLAEALSRS